jgi:hypothetical protein
MPAPKKAIPICCVTIGYQSFLMPAAIGMKVVDLMTSEVTCKRDYAMGEIYVPGDNPTVEYVSVRANQLVKEESQARKALPEPD